MALSNRINFRGGRTKARYNEIVKDGVLNPGLVVTGQGITQQSGYVQVNRVANTYNGGTVEGIDFTGYSTLTIDCQNAQTSPYFTVNLDGTPYYSGRNTQRQQYSVDVSAINGIKPLYVSLSENATGSAKLYNMILA